MKGVLGVVLAMIMMVCFLCWNIARVEQTKIDTEKAQAIAQHKEVVDMLTFISERLECK